MAEPTTTRESMRARLEQSRAVLSELIGGMSEAELQQLQVTPVWSGLEMLRHIWAWNEYALRCFDDWHGSRDWASQAGSDYDTYNHSLVAQRASLGRELLIAQIRAAYDRYEAMLEHDSDAELAEPGLAPWGEPTTRLGLIGTVDHDLEHYAHIREALAGSGAPPR